MLIRSFRFSRWTVLQLQPSTRCSLTLYSHPFLSYLYRFYPLWDTQSFPAHTYNLFYLSLLIYCALFAVHLSSSFLLLICISKIYFISVLWPSVSENDYSVVLHFFWIPYGLLFISGLWACLPPFQPHCTDCPRCPNQSPGYPIA